MALKEIGAFELFGLQIVALMQRLS